MILCALCHVPLCPAVIVGKGNNNNTRAAQISIPSAAKTGIFTNQMAVIMCFVMHLSPYPKFYWRSLCASLIRKEPDIDDVVVVPTSNKHTSNNQHQIVMLMDPDKKPPLFIGTVRLPVALLPEGEAMPELDWVHELPWLVK